MRVIEQDWPDNRPDQRRRVTAVVALLQAVASSAVHFSDIDWPESCGALAHLIEHLDAEIDTQEIPCSPSSV